jgi:hypothetical protein
MKRTFLVLTIVVCTAAATAQTESDIRNQITGTWKLVSTEETLKDGTTRPSFGPHARGFLMYQRDGYMCADLENPDRPKWANSENPTAEEKTAAGENTFAYCGRFEIDVTKRQIIHLPEVATDPGYVGSRQIRPYVVEGQRLILSDAVKGDPVVVRWKIVWEKVQ